MENHQFLKFSGAALAYYAACLILVESLGNPSIRARWIETSLVLIYIALDLSSHVGGVRKLGTGSALHDLAWSSVRNIELPAGVEFDWDLMVRIVKGDSGQIEIEYADEGQQFPLRVIGKGKLSGRAQISVKHSAAGSRVVIKAAPLFKVTDSGRRLRLVTTIEAAISAALDLSH